MTAVPSVVIGPALVRRCVTAVFLLLASLAPAGSAPATPEPAPEGYEWIGAFSFDYDVQYNGPDRDGHGVDDFAARQNASWTLRDGPGDQTHRRDVTGTDFWNIKADFVIRGHTSSRNTVPCVYPPGASATYLDVEDYEGRVVLTVQIHVRPGIGASPVDEPTIDGRRTWKEETIGCDGVKKSRDIDMGKWTTPGFSIAWNDSVFKPGQRTSYGRTANDPAWWGGMNRADLPLGHRHPEGGYGNFRWDLSLCPPD